MPGVARGISSSRYSPPSPPPSHLKLMSNRIGSLEFLMVPFGCLWLLMVAYGYLWLLMVAYGSLWLLMVP